jgi:hypothetical protein
MWLFTPFGFFSVVQKPGTKHLTVRSRVTDDLDRLRQQYMPDLSATVSGGGTDYPYRAEITHDAFARGLAQIARDINYGNFKDEVAIRLGRDRAAVYGDVWTALLKLEQHERR